MLKFAVKFDWWVAYVINYLQAPIIDIVYFVIVLLTFVENNSWICFMWQVMPNEFAGVAYEQK